LKCLPCPAIAKARAAQHALDLGSATSSRLSRGTLVERKVDERAQALLAYLRP
jgi:hypothetical protein